MPLNSKILNFYTEKCKFVIQQRKKLKNIWFKILQCLTWLERLYFKLVKGLGDIKLINETDYYTNLINEFYNISRDTIQKQLWKDQKIIELTRILRKTGNLKFFQNAFVFIMSLFTDNFLDTYECESKFIGDLIDSEKEILISTLRVEVI